MPELVLVGAVAIAGGAVGDQKGGDPLVLLLESTSREDEDATSAIGAVGDEVLGAVEDLVVAVLLGRRAHATRRRYPAAGLGQGEAAELLARGQGGQELLLLLLAAELERSGRRPASC